eukprot:312602_1
MDVEEKTETTTTTLSQVPWLKNAHVKGSRIRFIAILKTSDLHEFPKDALDDEQQFVSQLSKFDPKYIEFKYDVSGKIILPEKKKLKDKLYLQVMGKMFSTFAQGNNQYLHMIFSNGQDHSRYGLRSLFLKGGEKAFRAIWKDLDSLVRNGEMIET